MIPKYIAPINVDHSLVHKNPLVDTSVMSPIKYTIGRKVLVDDLNLYMIFYGAFWTDTQKNLIKEFANNIGSSDWYKITKLYYYQASNSSNKVYVNGAVRVAATVDDLGSMGNTLSGTDLPDLVQKYISSGTFPEDENGIYFIFTGSEVTEAMRPEIFGAKYFCSDYCGYHLSYPLPSGKQIQYAMIGNAQTQCFQSCGNSVNQLVSPNGDPAVDSLLSTFAHELTETVTDPLSESSAVRAWQDLWGNENADKCAWSFDDTITENGYSYNIQLGGKKYMIQANWSPTLQACQMNL